MRRSRGGESRIEGALAMFIWVALSAMGCHGVDQTVACEPGDCREGRVCELGRCVNADDAWRVGEEKDSAQGGASGDVGDGADSDVGMDRDRGGEELEPCVRFNEPTLDFGKALPGQRRVRQLRLSNCASTPFLISGFALSGDESFALSAWTIGSAPFELSGGEEVFVEIAHETAPATRARRMRGEMTFTIEAPLWDQGVSELVVPVLGEVVVEPAQNSCPVASGTAEPRDGSQPPQKSIEAIGLSSASIMLSGALSYDRDEGGRVERYAWSVEETPLNAEVAIQGATTMEASVTLFTPGDYMFRLSVFDEWGRESCVSSRVRVRVTSD